MLETGFRDTVVRERDQRCYLRLMLKKSLQAGIDGRDDILVMDLYEYIESETDSGYGGAF
jgi:hypothetical protein